MLRFGAETDHGKTQPKSVTSTEKPRKRMMLRAKEPAMSTRFFFAEAAWAMPSWLPMRRKRPWMRWGLRRFATALPLTAAIGDTREARLAGA